MAKTKTLSSRSITTQLESIEQHIYTLRGHRVMLDTELAQLYGVPTKVLNQAVKRNFERFPDDFMFQLTLEEAQAMRSQTVTASQKRNIRYRPYVFTEHGALMLSNVLNSKAAIVASIQVVRAFIRLRSVLETHKELAQKIEHLEKKFGTRLQKQDEKIKAIFDAIRQLMQPPPVPARKPIGFHS